MFVRRTYFGRGSSTNYDSFLNWTFSSPNMVRTVQTLLLPQLACRSRQHDRKCRLKVKSIYFNHPSQGNSTNYYFILGLRDKAAPPTSQPKFPPKRVKNLATLSSIFIFSSSTGELCSQPIRGNDRRLTKGECSQKMLPSEAFWSPNISRSTNTSN